MTPSDIKKMRIAEIFDSLQGEGLLAGTPSTFVRSSGCNLRCVWCDTPYTSWLPEGEIMTVADVVDRVRAMRPRHVVVTGGEPLLQSDVVDLCRILRRDGRHVTVETAGTVVPESPEGLLAAEPIADLMSISPKLASSAPPLDTQGSWHARHEAARRRDDVIRGLMAAGPYQLKFVIDSRTDLHEAIAWLDDLGLAAGHVDPAAVCFMPQGRSADELAGTSAWLEPECRRLGVHFAPRHHVAWFGYTRGT